MQASDDHTGENRRSSARPVVVGLRDEVVPGLGLGHLRHVVLEGDIVLRNLGDLGLQVHGLGVRRDDGLHRDRLAGHLVARQADALGRHAGALRTIKVSPDCLGALLSCR